MQGMKFAQLFTDIFDVAHVEKVMVDPSDKRMGYVWNIHLEAQDGGHIGTIITVVDATFEELCAGEPKLRERLKKEEEENRPMYNLEDEGEF